MRIFLRTLADGTGVAFDFAASSAEGKPWTIRSVDAAGNPDKSAPITDGKGSPHQVNLTVSQVEALEASLGVTLSADAVTIRDSEAFTAALTAGYVDISGGKRGKPTRKGVRPALPTIGEAARTRTRKGA